MSKTAVANKGQGEAPVNLYNTFFRKNDEQAKGRRCLLMSAAFVCLSDNLSTGVFYSAFLLQNNVNLAGIGILSFIPYIAALFSLLSPVVLGKFKKRKTILFVTRVIYYAIMILGTTFLPYLTSSSIVRIVGFCVLAFVGKSIFSLFSPGYSVWTQNYVPPKVRALYFSVSLCFSNILTYVTALVTSFFADSLRKTAYYGSVLIAVRLLSFVIGVFDCISLLLPKEYPYETSKERVNFGDVFRIPLKHRKFRSTMLLLLGYNIATYINVGILNAYFITNLNVSYVTVNIANFFYAVVLFITMGLWQKIIDKIGWFNTLCFSSLCAVPVYFGFAFVTKSNAASFFLLLRICEHFSAAGKNIVIANFAYINTPKKDSTCYYSFHSISNSLSIFAGMMAGTVIASFLEKSGIHIFSLSFDYGQFLYLLQAVLYIAVAAIAYKLAFSNDNTSKSLNIHKKI